MAKKKLLEDIKQRPGRFYRMPGDVMRDRRFSDEERLEILHAWAVVAEDATIASQVEQLIAEMQGRRALGGHAAE